MLEFRVAFEDVEFRVAEITSQLPSILADLANLSAFASDDPSLFPLNFSAFVDPGPPVALDVNVDVSAFLADGMAVDSAAFNASAVTVMSAVSAAVRGTEFASRVTSHAGLSNLTNITLLSAKLLKASPAPTPSPVFSGGIGSSEGANLGAMQTSDPYVNNHGTHGDHPECGHDWPCSSCRRSTVALSLLFILFPRLLTPPE